MAKRVPFDPLAIARSRPLSLKTLTLSPADLYNKGKLWTAPDAFPREILACKNLEKLLLYRAISYTGDSTIPDELGQLTRLRELTLGGLATTRLPESLGTLARLEILDLSYTDALHELPASIGKLTNLHTLLVDSVKMKTVPASLWKLTKLRRLRLPDSLTTLPSGIANLAALTELTVPARALAAVASELPRLSKLRTLHLEVAGDVTELPVELAKLPALTQLTVVANTLPRLSHIAATAPKLTKLDVIGTYMSPVRHAHEARTGEARGRVRTGDRVAGRGSPLRAAEAVDELLRSARGRDVIFHLMIDELEAGAELIVKRLRVVANHVEATALRRSLGTKRRDDDVSTGLHGIEDLLHVRPPCGRVGQEMEDGAIVPEVVHPSLELVGGHVAAQPTNRSTRFAESNARDVERGLGEVEHIDTRIPTSHEVVDQGCFATTDIDDARVEIGHGLADEIQRHVQVRLIPAHLIRALRLVHALPVILAVHQASVLAARGLAC